MSSSSNDELSARLLAGLIDTEHAPAAMSQAVALVLTLGLSSVFCGGMSLLREPFAAPCGVAAGLTGGIATGSICQTSLSSIWQPGTVIHLLRHCGCSN